MAARDTLAVYVIGLSGKCSEDYIGCGKSCMCRQFMYNEYAEESYSTLLQSEFDGCVINRQHTIYWGKKEEIYKEMLKGKCTFKAKINFEVFEHTLFYQDGTNQPFRGYENYENRVFTNLKNYLNMYAFKSCDDMLSPEEYGSKKFLLSCIVPVAYLYVVDVSQSCSIFEQQLHLMSKLMKLIKKKKHACVVVASKFDTYCQENVKRLESLASSLKVGVIQCSAKYNTNVDTAFKYLAAKALSLKKLSVNVLTHAEVAVQRREIIPTNDEKDDTKIDVIRHISMANKPWSMMVQNSTEDYDEPADSYKEKIYIPGDDSDSFESDDDHDEEKNEMLFDPKVVHDSVCNFDLLPADSRTAAWSNRTKMLPLSPSPLESSLNNLVMSDSSIMPLSVDGKHTKRGTQTDESLSHSYINNSITVQKDIQDHLQDDELSDESDGYVIKQFDFRTPITDKIQEDSPYLELIGSGDQTITKHDDFEFVEWWGIKKQTQESLAVTSAITQSDASVKYSCVDKINQMHAKATRSMATNGTMASTDKDIYDDIKANNSQSIYCNVSELRRIDSGYIRMYKLRNPSSKRDSDMYSYDYVDHSYVEMCKRRRRCIGVPPRNVRRIGYQPKINAFSDIIEEHPTYVNIRAINRHTISLPPRKNHAKPIPKRRATVKPPMPSRNIPRPGCYLSALSAVPKT